ncbi:MAG: ABC transporter substrate-binding protein [Candidatus Taylorbacteria bacterium]|nr:ABC transporter substrate-binding protein [Candidatus Taylorbacteria bacterium]
MNKKIGWGIAAVIVIIFVVWGFQQNLQPKSFKVGLISILSGDYAVVGESFKNGVVLAQETYNKNNPNSQVSIVIEDDGFNGGKGVSAYRKIVSVDKVDALINASTPTIDSIYDLVTKTNLPVIQLGEQGREPAVDNVFGIWPNSIASEYDYGVYMKNKGVKEMSIVYTNNDAMIRFVESFKKGFAGITHDFIIDSSEKDFRTHALKVSQGSPSNVGLFIFPQQGAQFMKEFLKVAKNKPQFFFDASFQSGYSDYQRIMGDLTVLDGTLVGTSQFDTTEDFKKAYKERYGVDAPFLADIGYDAFNILVTAYATDQKKWIENIKNISLDGATGKTEFDALGNRKPKTKIMVISGGKISEMK